MVEQNLDVLDRCQRVRRDLDDNHTESSSRLVRPGTAARSGPLGATIFCFEPFPPPANEIEGANTAGLCPVALRVGIVFGAIGCDHSSL